MDLVNEDFALIYLFLRKLCVRWEWGDISTEQEYTRNESYIFGRMR